MHFAIRHQTQYTYETAVVLSRHRMHLHPRSSTHQHVHASDLLITPEPTLLEERTDAFGNTKTIVSMSVPHTTFSVAASSRVETRTRTQNVDMFASSASLQDLYRHVKTLPFPQQSDIVQYCALTPATTPNRAIYSFAKDVIADAASGLDAAYRLSRVLFETFNFDNTASDVATPIATVFEQRRGVCQDFTHLALACLRAFRIPARYVSGYILTSPPPGLERLEGADASHAWISAWDPARGWVDFDPTNGLIVGDQHVTVAYGRDYHDISPIYGIILGGGAHDITVSVDVKPLS
ncbi:MAG: transglutaminase family protein [Pseudomonadota bacterium]